MDGLRERRKAGPMTTLIRRMPLLTVLSTALVLSLASCGGDDDSAADKGSPPPDSPPKGVFVGKAEGSGPYVALVTDGKEVTGYVCNGNKDAGVDEIVSVWLKPTAVASGKAALENRKGESVGTVAFSQAGATGTISVGGKDVSYAADLADGDAGLYRATKGAWDTPGSIEAGWIVLADGTQRGAIVTSQSEGADAGGGTSRAVRFVSHLPVILENAATLNVAQGSVNLGSASVPVQNITSVGTLRVDYVPEARPFMTPMT
jgi:hypothetical protein